MDGTLNGDAGELSRLMQAIARGDRRAFRRVYDLQAARLAGIAARITGDAGLARDVVHDAFVQVWREAARFDPERGSAEGWLIGLVRWRAIALTRRRGRESLGFEGSDEPDGAPDPLHMLMASDDGAALAACLRTLDPDRQHLMVRAYVEGLSHSELSRALGMPLGTVKSNIRRSLELLRRCLDQRVSR